MATAKTGQQLVSRIQRRLGFRGAGFKVEDILEELNDAQELLESRVELPWFLQVTDHEFTITANNPSVTIPTGFLREVDDDGWRIKTIGSDTISDSIYFQKVDFDGGLLREADVSEEGAETGRQTGDVRRYAIRDTTFYFFPTSTMDIGVIGSYYKSDDPITLGATNKWLANFPLLVMAHAGLVMAGAVEHASAEQRFTGTIQLWEKALATAIQNREQGARQYAMGRNNL